MNDYTFHSANGAILHVYTPNEVLDRGLELVTPTDQETRAMSFISLFGSDHTVASRVWLELQTTEIPLAHMNVVEDGTCLDDFLLALFFLKCYKKQVFNEIELKKSSTTIRKWAQFYITRIGALGTDKIFWPQGLTEEVEVITVGTIHCNVSGFTTACSGWDKAEFYSDKTQQHAFAYEIGFSAFEPQIVWKAGPYRASLTDKQIYERYGLKAKLEGTTTIGIAGSNCQGASRLSVVGPNDPAYTCPDLKLKMLQRHEKLIGIMKQWGCLSACSTSEPFRHTAEMHWFCFEAVVVLTQFQIEANPDLLKTI